MSPPPPCVLFEDEHLLVTSKPPGWNTHAPSLFAGEGLYDWLRHREPRWASLAIIHRLDKGTSGLLVFSKTPLANRSLTEQFASRSVGKTYTLLTDRSAPSDQFSVRSTLVRLGDRYVSRPGAAGAEAETEFRVLERYANGTSAISAIPRTGRTHQIRVHAADRGFPILGDEAYGGSAFKRLCLHATELTLRHPASGAPLRFESKPDFELEPSLALREALVAPQEGNCLRLVNGHPDGHAGWHVDRLGDHLLCSGEEQLALESLPLSDWRERYALRGIYRKHLRRQPGAESTAAASPSLVAGSEADEPFHVRENGVVYALRFQEGYSVGLFLDQRDNRRRLLSGHIAAGFPLFPAPSPGRQVLNVFAYTCAFSVCAALAGHATTSLDLSRKYLDWGRRNFELNGLKLAGHDFIYGDAFDWMRRLARKQRRFDLILLDPPTFSRSKDQGVFQAERDYRSLVETALPLLATNGVLFASTNAATLRPEVFLDQARAAIQAQRRQIEREHYFPQPPDFPSDREEPAYLKTLWLQVA